jgi:hypothetical protein
MASMAGSKGGILTETKSRLIALRKKKVAASPDKMQPEVLSLDRQQSGNS